LEKTRFCLPHKLPAAKLEMHGMMKERLLKISGSWLDSYLKGEVQGWIEKHPQKTRFDYYREIVRSMIERK
jgi:hypothetical protein